MGHWCSRSRHGWLVAIPIISEMSVIAQFVPPGPNGAHPAALWTCRCLDRLWDLGVHLHRRHHIGDVGDRPGRRAVGHPSVGILLPDVCWDGNGPIMSTHGTHPRYGHGRCMSLHIVLVNVVISCVGKCWGIVWGNRHVLVPGLCFCF